MVFTDKDMHVVTSQKKGKRGGGRGLCRQARWTVPGGGGVMCMLAKGQRSLPNWALAGLRGSNKVGM